MFLLEKEKLDRNEFFCVGSVREKCVALALWLLFHAHSRGGNTST